ncbi:MAG: PIN domain-containing protein [archaeon]
MILDTTVLIDLMRGDQQAKEAIARLKEPICITSLSMFELFTGLAQTSRPDRERSRIEAVIKGQTIIPFGKDAAIAAGTIDGELKRSGLPTHPIDVMIAGIAIHEGQGILTRNTKDFSRIKDIAVHAY